MNFPSIPWRSLAAAIPALILSVSPLHAAEGWSTNYEEAKAAAAKDKKDILMDFSGSDWSSWCAKLDKEIWSTEAFKQEAAKHFVLLGLDFPQQKELPKELKEQNDKLMEKYAIQGFPSILLTDSTGKPYALTGYLPGGPASYNEHLAELRKARESRDAAFAKAAAATGLDKAKALHEGLKAMDPEVVEGYYQEEVDQVIALDTEDTLGLKGKKAYAGRRSKLEEKLEEFAQDQKPKEFAEAIDAFIAGEKLTGEDLQDLMLTKLQVLGPGDMDRADSLLDEVIKVDPKTELAERARGIKERVVEMRKQVEKSKQDPKPE